MTPTRHRQQGATLLVALIFLVLMSLFAINAYRGSTTNLRVIGNMQSRQEAVGAAQVAIDRTLSSAAFSSNPEAVAANPVAVDIDANGTNDFEVRLAPRPKCFRAKPIKTVDLDAALPNDLACMKSGVVTTGGLETPEGAGAAANSMCAETEWNLRSEVTDQRTGADVAIHQGVAIRVLETDAANACK